MENIELSTIIQNNERKKCFLHRIWECSRLYANGVYNIRYIKSQNRWMIDERLLYDKNRKKKYRTNLLTAPLEIKSTRMILGRPRAYAIPHSQNPIDVASSQLGNALLDSHNYVMGFRETLLETIEEAIVSGNAFIHYGYDKDKEAVDGRNGSYWINTVMPENLIPIGKATSLEKMDAVIILECVSKLELYNRLGEYIINLGSPENEKISLDSLKQDNVQVYNQHSIESSYYNDTGANNDNYCIIHYYEKPNYKYDKGRYIEAVGKDSPIIYRYQTELPLIDCGIVYPIAHLKDVYSPNKFWGDGRVRMVIPLIQQYFELNDYIMDILQRYKPRWVAAEGAIDPENITQTGELLEFKPELSAYPPQIGQLPAMPQYYFTEINRVKSEIYEILATQDVSRGIRPPGIEAATALELLSRNDSSRITSPLMRMGWMIEKISRDFLKIVQKKYQGERAMPFLEGEQWKWYQFKSADLKGISDVRLQTEFTRPETASEKEQRIISLVAQTILTPAEAKEQLSIGTPDIFKTDFQLDEEQARRELRLMLQGNRVPVESWYALEVHWRIKNGFRKTEEYTKLDESIKSIIDEHCSIIYDLLSGGEQVLNTVSGNQPRNETSSRSELNALPPELAGRIQ